MGPLLSGMLIVGEPITVLDVASHTFTKHRLPVLRGHLCNCTAEPLDRRILSSFRGRIVLLQTTKYVQGNPGPTGNAYE